MDWKWVVEGLSAVQCGHLQEIKHSAARGHEL